MYLNFYSRQIIPYTPNLTLIFLVNNYIIEGNNIKMVKMLMKSRGKMLNLEAKIWFTKEMYPWCNMVAKDYAIYI